MIIVKLNPEDPHPDPLSEVQFDDGIPRRVTFSSGNNVYFADKILSRKIQQFFPSQPDHACRYGSLLVSSCNEGANLLDNQQDNRPLRIKVVDFDSQDPSEQKQAREIFKTSDCNGKISPRLAKILGGKRNTPFQFRLAWMKEWTDEQHHCPGISFLAKGTFLPDRQATEAKGYDLILDRSSVKGIAKEQLSQLLPCRDYELTKVAIGNRENAQQRIYDSSWQLLIWYSKEALQKDIIPATRAEAHQLAKLQQDPLKLARYIVEQYDKRATFAAQQSENHFDWEEEKEQQAKRSESRMISLLKADKYGQLLDHPKIADFLRSQLAKSWRDLAVKGGVKLTGIMAQPAYDIQPGTIIAPHLKDGTEVLITRYPIVCKDNIRKYLVDNKQAAATKLKHYRGCIFIHPSQAMTNHQCDFDGDNLVLIEANKIPHIAAETRQANEPTEYDAIIKRPKIDYTTQYNTLRQIAVAIPKNQIGRIATAIGRVKSSVAHPDEPQGMFKHKQRKLLQRLFNGLQIEVDSPKSVERSLDIDPKLLDDTKTWTKRYPCHLFDFKTDERLYKSMPMPVSGDNAINVIAREAVNPEWEPTRIRSRGRDEFRYLFPPPQHPKQHQQWKQYYLPWAEEFKERVRTRQMQIHQQCSDGESIVQEYGKLYEDLRAEIADSFPDKQERKLAAAALWHVETSSPNLSEPRRECVKLSRQLKITFELEKNYQRLHEALPQDTYVLSVPFETYSKDSNGRYQKDEKGKRIAQDLAGVWRSKLEQYGIQYEATLDKNLPMVRFALLNPSSKLIEKLDSAFGHNDNYHISNEQLSYTNTLGENKSLRIIPPIHYNWLESTEDITPKSALSLNLFTEEICEQLENYQFEQIELIGQKYNDLADEDFSNRQWQNYQVKLTVGAFDKPDDRRHGFPIVQLEGKNLAMFSSNSPKLPIGATFEATINIANKGTALTLIVDPDSVQLPEPTQVNESTKKVKLNLNSVQIAQPIHQQQNLLEVENGIIVHQVNCQGKIGKGLAKDIANKYPKVKEEYLKKFQNEGWQLGEVQFVQVKDNLWVANVAGQQYWGENRRQTNTEALGTALKQVRTFAEDNHLAIHVPYRLGSGLAGGATTEEKAHTWKQVEKVILAECPNAIICHPSSDMRSQSTELHSPSSNDNISQTLQEALSEYYAQQPQSKFRVTEDWTAFVHPETHNCYVRDRNRDLIFQSNLKNGNINKPLADEYRQAFVERIQKLAQNEETLHQQTDQQPTLED